MTLLVASCGSGDPPRPDVALLPTAGTGSQVWHWTPQCTFAPAASQGCRTAGPRIGFGQLNGNAWNLGGPARAGSLDMSVGSKGEVTIEGNFARTAPCTDSDCIAPNAFTWVRGYPNVLYGIDQCHAGTSPPPSPRLPLPMRLDSIPPHLIGVTAYSAQTPQVTYDVAYDLWLAPTGTKRPCTSQGTLEIMIWTDYNARALLPASLQVGTASVPVAVNGTARKSTRPWAIYASNVYKNGRTAPWGGTLWFVPDPADVVRGGRVSVDLSEVLTAAGLVLRANYGWPDFDKRYWLDTASFGVEFGPPSGDPMDPGPSRFSAQISAYCLDTATKLRDAACG